MNNTFPTEGNLSGLSRKDFQKDINDKKTDLFILKNTKGMEVAVTNYGASRRIGHEPVHAVTDAPFFLSWYRTKTVSMLM